MTIKRRKKVGASLLLAGAGVTVSMATSCIGVSGNLMAPPTVELCIEVDPETADVVVNGITVLDGECTTVFEGDTNSIEATADGYEDYEEELSITSDTTHTIEMVLEGENATGGGPEDTAD